MMFMIDNSQIFQHCQKTQNELNFSGGQNSIASNQHKSARLFNEAACIKKIQT